MGSERRTRRSCFFFLSFFLSLYRFFLYLDGLGQAAQGHVKQGREREKSPRWSENKQRRREGLKTLELPLSLSIVIDSVPLHFAKKKEKKENGKRARRRRALRSGRARAPSAGLALSPFDLGGPVPSGARQGARLTFLARRQGEKSEGTRRAENNRTAF